MTLSVSNKQKGGWMREVKLVERADDKRQMNEDTPGKNVQYMRDSLEKRGDRCGCKDDFECKTQ